MALIEREMLIMLMEEKGPRCGITVSNICNFKEFVRMAPTIDPIRAAGGCRCGECKKYMTPECLLCSFDVDGSCTGGPESDFYCGDSELEEAQDDG